MPDYVRAAEFEADEAALDALRKEIESSDGPPPEVPAKGIMILADRAAGRVRVIVRFGSEEDLRKGSEALDSMNPPEGGNIRRLSVETYEVVLEREAP
jgi:hypothetical protein